MQQRRRRLLRATAGALTVGLAGCAGDGGDGSDGADGSDGSGEDGADGSTAEGTATGDGSDAGGGTADGQKVPPGELGPPVAGDPEADVTVSVFEDLRCPHCADFNAEVFPRLREAYIDGGRIRYEHRDFPVVNQWSTNYAYAARSVQAQAGDDAFYTFAKDVFERQTEQSWALVREVAANAGADPDVTEADGTEGTYGSVVEADQSAGRDRGVSGTPTVFVGDAQAGGSSWDEVYQDIATKIDERL